MKKNKIISVMIPFAEGFEEAEAVIIVDLLRRVDINVIMAGCSCLEVKSARGIRVICDCLLSDVKPDSLNGIVLPGGLPGTNNLMKDIVLRDMIIDLDRQNILVAAICAAPKVLHAAGVLTGRKVTSHPSVANEFNGCVYSESSVVCDGNVITSRAVGTAIPFGLALIEYFFDKDKAQFVAKAILG
jgi:4-methyl-5(b-hydroxyethyl)-thiazole monophosphate biosynthesis